MTQPMRLAVALGSAVLLSASLLAGGETCAAAAGTCPASKVAATKAGQVKVSYQVSGMSCGACETKVAKALNAIEGVSDATACADSKQAKLVYDPKKVKEKQLLAAIEKAGFKVETEQVDLKIDSLACGECSGKVSKVLAALDGVKAQEVCHEAKHAVVTFDPKKLSREQVIAAIDKTGFPVVQ